MSAYLSDISQSYGNDIDETPDGDIAIASGKTLTIQRIIRRLLNVATTPTNSPYPWVPSYGGSLPVRIGLPISVLELNGVMLAQMRQEASVAQSPAPKPSISIRLCRPRTSTR